MGGPGGGARSSRGSRGSGAVWLGYYAAGFCAGSRRTNGSGHPLSACAGANPPDFKVVVGGGKGRLNLPTLSNTPPKGRRIYVYTHTYSHSDKVYLHNVPKRPFRCAGEDAALQASAGLKMGPR